MLDHDTQGEEPYWRQHPRPAPDGSSSLSEHAEKICLIFPVSLDEPQILAVTHVILTLIVSRGE
jgi:hypothetical protein